MSETKKMEGRTISNGDFEGLFPFLILLLVGLLRLLKAKKKKETAQKPPLLRRVAPQPPRELLPPEPVQVRREIRSKPPVSKHIPLQVKKDEHFLRKEKKIRIQTLVKSTGNKRKMFLLSEILRTPHF